MADDAGLYRTSRAANSKELGDRSFLGNKGRDREKRIAGPHRVHHFVCEGSLRMYHASRIQPDGPRFAKRNHHLIRDPAKDEKRVRDRTIPILRCQPSLGLIDA